MPNPAMGARFFGSLKPGRVRLELPGLHTCEFPKKKEAFLEFGVDSGLGFGFLGVQGVGLRAV